MPIPSNQIWLGGVVGYHVSLTRHSPSDTEGPEFKPRLSHYKRSRALFTYLRTDVGDCDARVLRQVE
jgi:hypothetical protein